MKKPSQKIALWIFIAAVCSVVVVPLLAFDAEVAGSQADNTPLWSYRTDDLVYSVAISSDGSYIAAGSRDNRVYLFSRSDNTPLWSYQPSGWVIQVVISSDGSYIAVVSDAGVYLFSRTSSTPLWSYQTGSIVRPVSISSDGSYVAAGSRDCKVYLFSRYENSPLWSYHTEWDIVSVAISSDGSYIAAGNDDGEVYMFSRSSGTPLWSYDAKEAHQRHNGESYRVIVSWDIAISSDGSYAVAGNSYGEIYLFSRFDNIPLWSCTTWGYVTPVAISSDGSYIVAGSSSGSIYMFGNPSIAVGNRLWLLLLYFIISTIFAAWVYRDSKNRRMNRGAWAGLTFLASVVGLAAYLKRRGARRKR